MLSLNVQPPGRGEDQGKQVGALRKAQKNLGPEEYGTQAHEKTQSRFIIYFTWVLKACKEERIACQQEMIALGETHTHTQHRKQCGGQLQIYCYNLV